MSPLFSQKELVEGQLAYPSLMEGYWPIFLAVVLGAAAVYLLLPRPRRYPIYFGLVLGLAAMAVVSVWLIRAERIWVETVLFYSFAGLAVIFGGVMISQTQPVRAALSFALVVLSTCGLFLLQAAPFLMAATIIIYAGAIVVTFLFVIMLAQQSGLDSADYRSREPMLACVAGFVLLGALLYVLASSYTEMPRSQTAKNLRPLVQEVDMARKAESRDEVKEALEKPEDVFDKLRKLAQSDEAKSNKTKALADQLVAASDDCTQAWLEEQEFDKLHRDLNTLYERGRRLEFALSGTLTPPANLALSSFSGTPPNEPPALDRTGRAVMPADNVSAIGRSLFTDYLLAVELAATLLLVATIGAIVIAGRRSEVLR